jgi:predicted RNA-binding Zn-ribbon protein involved in translation (DUF1610 family)
MKSLEDKEETKITRPRCRNCGAPIEGTNEIVGFKCRYCGEINIMIDETLSRLIKTPETMEHTEMRGLIRKFLLEEVGQKASIYRMHSYVLPIWRGRATGRCYYRGYRKEVKTRTRKVGKNTVVETYTICIPIEGERDIDEAISTPGKIDIEIYALDEILGNAKEIGKYIEIERFIDKGWNIVIPDINYHEAREEMDDEIEDILYRWAEGEMTEVFEVTPNISIKDIDLIPYPIIEFTYLYRGRRYKGVADPTQKKVIRMEKPLTPLKKMIYTVLSYSSIALGTLASYIIHQPESIIAALLTAGIGGYMIWKATSSEEIYD